MSTISSNLKQITDSIFEAEQAAGRIRGSVRLVAVSKFHPAQAVLEAIASGQTLFGENRVQEAAAKFETVRAAYPAAELHIIGSLQRNKVKSAVQCASCIQSVDRQELLEEIQKQAEKLGKKIRVLFEFHTGEDSKSGFTDADSVFRAIEFAESASCLVPAGFMTMAPFTQDSRLVSESFRKLSGLRTAAQARFPELELTELSMGMSADYRIAIAEGATMVRIGTAIFGERQSV
ncbi:YggS family pyridoxal phosphate-dependent enzyme [Treponema brennaborense]|uniref:Pyridoxal phosphate homeostasis protein n=1 Tax=Treponema brennaborense (strain DSM 12168 / CIP 105900 / DD5/3) TaxID=906968 RepID=F4LM48_TREBD|nr:YggS family pyridoxal phosphate-dependent enzyme [Treponema brennaborense]AEE16727.1 protein of unknown function UPF0001 [Treponema brennaborense DSM 12168]